MILSLQPPDTIHLQAAHGWLELGNHIEANEELEKITARLRVHPDVLELRWRIFAAAKNWEAALDIASALIQIDPENPAGWEDRSYSLDELGRPAEARDNLLRVVDRFPKNAIVRYNPGLVRNASWAVCRRRKPGWKRRSRLVTRGC